MILWMILISWKRIWWRRLYWSLSCFCYYYYYYWSSFYLALCVRIHSMDRHDFFSIHPFSVTILFFGSVIGYPHFPHFDTRYLTSDQMELKEELLFEKGFDEWPEIYETQKKHWPNVEFNLEFFILFNLLAAGRLMLLVWWPIFK